MSELRENVIDAHDRFRPKYVPEPYAMGFCQFLAEAFEVDLPCDTEPHE